MAQFNPLIDAAYKAINNAHTLVENEHTPFNAMYKQYKSLQSFWFRVIEDAADSNSSKLEDLCVDLEEAMQDCKAWLGTHSPSTNPKIEKVEPVEN